MQKVFLDLSPQQAQQLLEQLPAARRLALVRRWEQETWPVRLRQLLARIDQRLQRNPRLARQALKVIGPVRRAFYARRDRH